MTDYFIGADGSEVLVRDIAERAIEALEAAGYAESTLRQYRKFFRYLEDACPGGRWDPDAARAFAEAGRPDGRPYHRSYQTTRARVVALCEDWVGDGAFDLGLRSGRPEPTQPSSEALQATLGDYARTLEERELAESTRDYYLRLAREFLLFVEGRGARDASSVLASDVTGFMADISGRWQGTSTYHIAASFRPFLHYLGGDPGGRNELVEALALTGPFRERKTLPALTDEEADAVAGACVDGTVAPMDAAVTLLLLTTGMRACDVVALRLSDLDFRRMTISFVQSKTGNPVTLPMAPALGDALGRYILEARPDSDSPHVFLRSMAPHGPLSGHCAVYQASERAMAAAGVDGGGSLLLRHSAASKMVAAGTPLPVVSSVLGHADPSSSDAYIEADAGTMRSLCLPLPEGVAS